MTPPPVSIASLARRFDLDPRQAQRLERLLTLIVDDDAAPTTVRERQRVLDDHLADSLVSLELDAVPWQRGVTAGPTAPSGAGDPAAPRVTADPTPPRVTADPAAPGVTADPTPPSRAGAGAPANPRRAGFADPVTPSLPDPADSRGRLSGIGSQLRIADLGAGAGFPGLALAIALPGAPVTLVESNARKCVFLERAVSVCGLDNVAIVRERAELWRDGLEACELVVARALAPLPVVAEYAAPLLAPGGMLVAWRGRRDPGEELAARRAAATLGLAPQEPVAVSPYRQAQHRHLQVMVKEAPTPARFPRRPGAARKHPLGA